MLTAFVFSLSLKDERIQGSHNDISFLTHRYDICYTSFKSLRNKKHIHKWKGYTKIRTCNTIKFTTISEFIPFYVNNNPIQMGNIKPREWEWTEHQQQQEHNSNMENKCDVDEVKC